DMSLRAARSRPARRSICFSMRAVVRNGHGRGLTPVTAARHDCGMRIIAGSRKGHGIDAPKGLATRPTSDRVRENVFNLVAPWVGDAAVLDLFAGSGAMGLEALSRGAGRAGFVESHAAACRVIDRNLEK